MIHVGIIGSEGYAVGELVSLLINHPDAVLERVYAPERAGLKVSDLHPGLFGERPIDFTAEEHFDDLDVLFLCVPSGEARKFLQTHKLPETLKIIDFTGDHRQWGQNSDMDFVYGLSECYRRKICHAQRVSVPGCFAVSIELALLPLAKHLLLNHDIHICSVSGRTETVARPKQMSHVTYDLFFDNFSVYKPFGHPQVEEVTQVLTDVQKSFKNKLYFVPMRGNFNRGIYTTLYLPCSVKLDTLYELYQDYYSDHAFVHLVNHYPDVRDTVNTNHALLHLSQHEEQLMVVCTLDNLMKGAAGTAVHLMNLMMGLVENTGLKIKSSAY